MKYEEYEELIENLLLTALANEQYMFIVEEDIFSLFSFRDVNEDRTEK